MPKPYGLYERLLQAFTKAHLRANRLDEANPKPDLEEYAAWLDRNIEALDEELLDVPFQAQLSGRDVRTVRQLQRKVANLERQLADRTFEAESLIRMLVEARNIMKSGRGDYDDRLSEAGKILGLIGQKKYPHDLVLFHYEQLTSSLYPRDNTVEPQKKSKNAALSELCAKWGFPSEEAADQAVKRARKERNQKSRDS